jgi:hypothetical protein
VKIRAVINAQQFQSVALTEANKNLEVAKLENEAAVFQAKAKMALGEAQRDVIKMKMEAEANALQQKVKSFENGSLWARYVFYKTIAGKIKHIFTDDQGAIGKIFNQFTAPSSQKGGNQ